MGQFLSIGICTNIGISKEKLKLKGFTLEDVQIELSKKFNIEVFDYIKTEDEYHQWQINKSIFTSEIKNFLTQIYSDYGVIDEDLMNKISYMQSFEEFIEYAGTKSHENFQRASVGNPDFIELGNFANSLQIYTSHIGLFYAGKISMECYNKMFSFFRNNMRHSYSKYKISGALNVYITG